MMKDWLKPYFYLMPALLIILIFFLGGFILAFIQSFGYLPIIGQGEFTLKYYTQVLTDGEFLKSLYFTLYIAFVSTVISTIIGTLLAYYFLKAAIKEKLVIFFYKLPIAVPHLVAALMLVFLLGQGGILSRLLIKLGFISETSSFPALFYSKNAIGIILIYIWKEIPFITFMVYLVMKNIHVKLGEAAAMLNASSSQVFRYITLPLSMPSIISASAIVFAFSFGAFEIPYLLGATYPKTLSVWAYLNYISADLGMRPIAMAINIIISLICSLLVLVYYRSSKKYLQG